MEQDPELFWGVVNSMYIGNILLLIMSLPLVGLFVKILRVRAAILAADPAFYSTRPTTLTVSRTPDGVPAPLLEV